MAFLTPSAATTPDQHFANIHQPSVPSQPLDDTPAATMDQEVSITQKMLSAVSGSILTSLLVTPLDVVRVRLQAQSEETQRRTFNSTLDGLKKIARNEGLTTLWRGLSPTLLMSVPANVIYFAGYDWLRANPNSPMKDRVSDNYAPLFAGSSARVLAAIVVSPIEMFRTRMQASHPEAATPTGVFRDTMSEVKDMVKADGYRALWRGLGLTLWRDVPFSALYWWGYEYGRQTLHNAREGPGSHEPTGSLKNRAVSDLDHKTVLVDSFIAGASAGAIAAFVTTPFDVGKTRQQVARHSTDAASSAASAVRPEDKLMPRFLWHIYKTEGTAGLFKGWAARTMKVAPACAIMISSYEIGKKMAGSMNEKAVKESSS